ncbi:MAG: N-acetyltransferase family protein [Bacillota bacterium]
MTVEIRLSKELDFGQLIDLDHRIWSSTTTPSKIAWESIEEFAKRNPEGSQVVAIVDGKVAGYLGFHAPTPLETNQHVIELDIAVDVRFQGRGIGKQLLEKGKNEAIQKGIHKLSLRVLETNEGAIQFYKKCGFIEQGRLINEFYIEGKYVDDLLMYMLLD